MLLYRRACSVHFVYKISELISKTDFGSSSPNNCSRKLLFTRLIGWVKVLRPLCCNVRFVGVSRVLSCLVLCCLMIGKTAAGFLADVCRPMALQLYQRHCRSSSKWFCSIHLSSAVLGWPFVKRFALCYRNRLFCLCNLSSLWRWCVVDKRFDGSRCHLVRR